MSARCGLTTTDAAPESCHQNGPMAASCSASATVSSLGPCTWAHRIPGVDLLSYSNQTTKQLNLYHENRNDDNSCRAHQAYRGVQETLAHIFWDCPKARSCWAKLIVHWTGETVADLFGTCQYLGSANRQAPAISPRLQHRLHKRFTDDAAAGVHVWKRIWFLMSTMCLTHLWQERNDAVFRGVLTTASHSVARFWETGIRQLFALAKREHRGIGTVVQGALLHAGIELFTQAPRDIEAAPGNSHETLPDPDLISWLRSFQTSCT